MPNGSYLRTTGTLLRIAISRLSRLSLLQSASNLVTRIEGSWFDWSRGISTSGFIALDTLTLAGSPDDGFMYLPARPMRIRQALRKVRLRDSSAYTFIDLGSGKGRALFVAAEYPFCRVLGVEFAIELHHQAEINITRYNRLRRKCSCIESLHTNVTDFQFPT